MNEIKTPSWLAGLRVEYYAENDDATYSDGPYESAGDAMDVASEEKSVSSVRVCFLNPDEMEILFERTFRFNNCISSAVNVNNN